MKDNLLLSNLSVRYSSGDGQYIDALKRISMELHQSRINYLCGPNGSGKSTLLKAIAGQVSLRTGSIHLESVESDLPKRVFLRQSPMDNLVRDLTVKEHLFLAAGANNVFRQPFQFVRRSSIPSEGLRYIRQTLPALENKLASQVQFLSGGQQQALAIVCAVLFAKGSGILLLDEPTASLDSSARSLLASLLRSIVSSSRIWIIVATHDFDLVAEAPGTVVTLKGGNVTNVSDVVSNEDLQHVLSRLYGNQPTQDSR